MNIRYAVKLALTVVLAVACSASAEDRPMRVACVGDSITAGVGAGTRRTQTCPAQPAAINERSIVEDIVPLVTAVSRKSRTSLPIA